MTTGDDTDEVADDDAGVILTPDQRVRVFVSSTMEELATERVAVRDAVEQLHLSPVLFELGARAHPPRSLYRSYLEQSHVFVGIYWERYGWIAPTMRVSGLEDEYLLAGAKPKLMYVKRPAPGRETRLNDLLDRIRSDDDVAYKAFADASELETLVINDLSLLLSEAFLIVPGAPAARPSHAALPADVTAFIGRDDELDMLRGLLTRDDVRLVTLTGPGGIGKTRLALRAAAQAAASFGEGAAFVSLASVHDDAEVVDAIAAAIGVRDNSGPSVDTLKADLSTRSLLLVIDNFEQVLSAAGIVSELLSAAPGLRILATSREALHLRSEWEVPVSSLPLEDSVRLFTERAMAVRAEFRIDDSNRDVIDRVCERLEGVPLAIELAAARTKLLAPAALLERLDHRLDFLVGGARDLPERQQALRRTIEWSHDLLDEPERHLFHCLGVFVGSFSLSAVEGVVGDVATDRDVLDLLASLVDKSLVRVEASAGEPRFRMLEMIAEFARDQLAASDDADAVAEHHARFFREVSAEIGAGVTSGDQRRWLSMLGGEEDGEAGNIRAALAWYLEHRQLDELADMAWSLWVPAWINGRIEEGSRICGAALDLGSNLSEISRSRLLVVHGTFEMWSGDHVAATESLQRGRAVAVELGDDPVIAAATLAQSMIAGPVDGEARSEELANEALDRYERLGDTWGKAAALNALGWLYVSQERFDSADLFERTLDASLAAGDEQFSALAEVNLAEFHLHDGDAEACRALLISCADRHRSLRMLYSVAYLLESFARLAAHEGDPVRAAQLLGAAAQLRSSTGVSVWGSQLDRQERFVSGTRSALGEEQFATAFGTGAGLSYAEALDLACG